MTPSSQNATQSQNKVLVFVTFMMLHVLLTGPSQAAVTQCQTSTMTYTENFTTNTYLDRFGSAVRGWPGTSGITAPTTSGIDLGAATSTFNVGTTLVSLAAIDCDGDGNTDLIGYDYTNQQMVCYLWRSGSTAFANPTTVSGSLGANVDNMALAVGDINGDGYDDFVVGLNNFTTNGLLTNLYVYINTSSSGTVGFSRTTNSSYNLPTPNPNISWHGQGAALALYDTNRDGYADLYTLASSGNNAFVTRYNAITPDNPNSGAFPFDLAGTVVIPQIATAIPIASNANQVTPGFACADVNSNSNSRGPTGLYVGPAAGMPGANIIITSASEGNIHAYFVQKDGSYRRGLDYPYPPGGIAKIDTDPGGGFFSFVRQGDTCGSPNAAASFGYLITVNNDRAMNFVDVGFNRGRQNVVNHFDGAIQFSAYAPSSSSNPNSVYYFGRRSQQGEVHAITLPAGTKYVYLNYINSKVVNPPSTQSGSISQVAVTKLSYSNPNGTTMSFSVTNDGGASYTVVDPNYYNTSTPIKFKTFGNQLKWASNFSSTGSNTVNISAVTLTYTVNQPTFFSRAGIAHSAGAQDNNTTYFYTNGFIYPGWVGHLYGEYTGKVGTASNQNLTLVSTPGIAGGNMIAGDAATWLSQNARTLYTLRPTAAASTGNYLIGGTRMPFSYSELNSPSGSPNLLQMLACASIEANNTLLYSLGTRGDPNNNKFYDPGMSTPVFVGPPAQDVSFMGSGYASFQTAQASRRGFLLQGANDGFLHSFDGSPPFGENWGYIPKNLLTQAKFQHGYNGNPNVKSAFYNHQYMVDGPTTVGDVQYNSQWSTIAITGQGAGTGTSNNYYYFALDVTSPTNPKPLWEFTDPGSSLGSLCVSSNPNTYSSTGVFGCGSDAGGQTTGLYNSSMISSINDGFYPASLVEAENYDDRINQGSSYWSVPYGVQYTTQGQNARANSYIAPFFMSNSCSTSAFYNCPAVSYRIRPYPYNYTAKFFLWARVYLKKNTTQSLIYALNYQPSYPSSVPVSNYTVVDNSLLASLGLGNNGWGWANIGNFTLSPNAISSITFFGTDTNLNIDSIYVTSNPSSTGPSNSQGETPDFLYGQDCNTGVPGVSAQPTTNVASPAANGEWAQCGLGSGQKCCADGNSGTYFCSPASQACPTTGASSQMGPARSKPAIGRFYSTSGEVWAVFFASGLPLDINLNLSGLGSGPPNQGRSVYALNAYTGALLGQWTIPAINTANTFNVPTAISGGIRMVDSDGDGYVDRVYFGDTTGTLWKINTYGSIPSSSSPLCAMFDAGDPNQSGSRISAPITMRPEAGFVSNNTVNIYFGTGGLDAAASGSIPFKFYSIQDVDALSACSNQVRAESSLSIAKGEWVIGDGKDNTAKKNTLTDPNSEGTVGDKYYADPIIINNSEIYFTSTNGPIDTIDPCIVLQQSSKIFGYAIRNFRDAAGVSHTPGTSLFTSKAFLNTAAPVRQAPSLPTLALEGPSRSIVPQNTASQTLFIQQVDGSVYSLATQGLIASHPLQVLSWREISSNPTP